MTSKGLWFDGVLDHAGRFGHWGYIDLFICLTVSSLRLYFLMEGRRLRDKGINMLSVSAGRIHAVATARRSPQARASHVLSKTELVPRAWVV